jgi:hypothetical protein
MLLEANPDTITVIKEGQIFLHYFIYSLISRFSIKVSDINCSIEIRLFFEFSVERMPATNPLRLTGLRSPLGIGNRFLGTATRYFEN